MNERLPGTTLESAPAQYHALLEVTESIAAHHDLAELFRDLVQKLPSVVQCSSVAMVLHDPDKHVMRLHVLEAPNLAQVSPEPEYPVDDVPGGWVWQHQQPFVCMSTEQETRFPKVMPMIRAAGVRSLCVVPLTTARRRLGAIGIGSLEEHPYEPDEIAFLQLIAKQVAVAVENALNFERAYQAEKEARRRFERERLMLEINNAVVSQLDLRKLVRVISTCLSGALEIDAVGLSLYEPETSCFRVYYYDLPNTIPPIEAGATIPVEGSIGGLALTLGKPILINRASAAESFPESKRRFYDQGFNSGGCVPLIIQGRKLGVLGVLSFREEAFPEERQQLLSQIADQIALAVDNMLNFERARQVGQDMKRQFERERLMLEINNAVVSHLSLRDLLKAISFSLRRIIPHDASLLTLHEPGSEQLRLHALDLQMFGTVPFEEGVLISLHDTPEGQAIASRRPVLVGPVVDLERFSSPWVRHAVENGVRSGCAVPLISHDRTLGALSVVSLREDAFKKAEAELLAQCAAQIAIAVENALNFARAHQAEKEMRRQYERERLMLEINNAVVSHLELPKLLKTVSACLSQVIPHDLAGIALYDPGTRQLVAHALDFPQNQDFVTMGSPIPIEGTPEGLAFRSRRKVLIKKLSLTEFTAEIMKRAAAEGLKSGCTVPLMSRGRALGTLSIVSRYEDAFSEDDAELFDRIGSQIAIAVENGLAYQEIATLKDKLNKEKLYLEDEIRSELNFDEIVGESSAIKKVLKQVGIVAPTDSTVLILGETGTGKELLARAIHDRSKRRERTFVKLNCAAIPTGLLESELFGHERGAFTGAIATKVGRFELADGGTLFLDEVGDIPLELQSKLLRVLQEQEFERLGSTRTIKVNVRLLAATNRDLAKMVEQNLFRSDLYYRLNVFPILSPSLRDRTGDIPILVRYFTQRFARRMEKRIERIPLDAMDALCRYQWPGNVRELENFIERAVILSQGTDLSVPLGELKTTVRDGHQPVTTLQAAERDHILLALDKTNWVIAGPSGAATLLGMKRSTLQSRMVKLGISRRS